MNGHDPQTWADALASVVLDPPVRARLAAAAPVHAALFSWEVTVDGLLESYARALRGGRTIDQPPREPAHASIDPQLLPSAHR